MRGGPNGLVEVCRDKLHEIAAELELCTDTKRRKGLSSTSVCYT